MMNSPREEVLSGTLALNIGWEPKLHTEEDNGYGDEDHENMVVAKERYQP